MASRYTLSYIPPPIWIRLNSMESGTSTENTITLHLSLLATLIAFSCSCVSSPSWLAMENIFLPPSYLTMKSKYWALIPQELHQKKKLFPGITHMCTFGSGILYIPVLAHIWIFIILLLYFLKSFPEPFVDLFSD